MGLNFRKSIKVADGVKLNVGKKSAGVSVVGKYVGASFNSRTGARVRASLPGTGLSYTKSLGGSKKRSTSKKRKKSMASTILLVAVVVLAVLFVVYKNWDKISDTLGIGQTAVTTDQAAGNAAADQAVSVDNGSATYVINTSTKKIHLSTCSYVDMSSKNVSETDETLETLVGEGYEKCSRCLK